MPYYEINWTKFGTALIEAELEGVLKERPSHTGSYDPVSLG